MATAMLPFFLSLVSLCLINANGVNSFEKKMFNMQMLQKKQQLGTQGCLLPESKREYNSIILEMKDRGHCSEKKIDWTKRLQKQLILDELRVRSIQNRIRKISSSHNVEASQTQIPLASGVNLQTLNYIVTMGLDKQNMTVIVDTGSDLTWVQCEPCMSCYNQQGPVFKPSTSSSYQSVSCNSSTCQSLRLATGNTGACGRNPSTCNYEVNYGDGSYTNGDLVSGLMGLGRSKLSLVSQTIATFGGVFSYCLPTTEAAASGSLVMGNESSVFNNVTPISYTRMLTNPQLSSFYILNLTGMDVGGVALLAPSFGSGGIMIDSGTVITRLPSSVYKALKAEFLKQFSGFPPAPGFSILDTCFNLTGYDEVSIPTINMHFEDNAELNVDATGIFYMVKEDASQVCLAISSLSDPYDTAIIGNYQQRNQRVIYDTKQSKVGFAVEQCSFS
ncbi:hypothetical protein Fmac_025862 [Flemingia macrophylla]|uniref:Peptidase A1 domain-containing protein n=1 Tax=Flemingia macrophylla TaxID=520843 RepID=A0ABD1LDT0_9FABA